MVPPGIGRPCSSIMRVTVLLCAITLVTANRPHLVNVEPKCEGVEVRGAFHSEAVLAKGLNRPYQLSYHHEKRDIYFSNNVGNDTEDSFEIMRLDENGTLTVISEVENGFATAIDEKEQVAYLGGSNGVYKLHLHHGNISHVDNTHNIWYMFFKHDLYFINYPSQKLYRYKDNQHSKAVREKWVTEKIFQFAIDGEGDIFLTNTTGLFMIKKGSHERKLIRGESVFRAIVVHTLGEAYFCGQNSIFVVNKKKHELESIAHIKNIFGLTFDNVGNFIYSNPHQIVRLIRSECKVIKNVASYIPVP